MARRYALRDQWDRIEGLLPGREGHVGDTVRDNRVFVEAVLSRYRAGIPWRDLPSRFGDFRVIHTRRRCWSKSGVWEKVFKHLATDADKEYDLIDATIIRAHQHAAGAKGGTERQNASAAPAGACARKSLRRALRSGIRPASISRPATPPTALQRDNGLLGLHRLITRKVLTLQSGRTGHGSVGGG